MTERIAPHEKRIRVGQPLFTMQGMCALPPTVDGQRDPADLGGVILSVHPAPIPPTVPPADRGQLEVGRGQARVDRKTSQPCPLTTVQTAEHAAVRSTLIC